MVWSIGKQIKLYKNYREAFCSNFGIYHNWLYHWRSTFTFCLSEPGGMVLCSLTVCLLPSPFLILCISFPNLRKNMCVHAKSLQSCPTVCDPMDCSLPGSSVHGDSPGKNTGVGCPPPEDLPNSGIRPKSLALQVGSFLLCR